MKGSLRQRLRQSERRPRFVVYFVANLVGPLLLSLFLPLASLAAESPSPLPRDGDNPALERFAQSIVWYASLDGHALAELTPGNPVPTGNTNWTAALQSGALRFEPGVFGQGLVTSNVDYQVTYACNAAVLSAAGSIALWLKPVALSHRGTYYWPVILDAAAGGYRVMFGRMGDPLNHEALYAYLSHRGQGVSATWGSMARWQPGEWHLLVVTWDRTGLSFSVDGSMPTRTTLKAPLPAAAAGGFRLFTFASGGDTFVYDELMLLNIPLNLDEIKWLWESGKGPGK